MTDNTAALLQVLFNGVVNGTIYALLAVGFALFHLVHRFFYLAFGGVILSSAIAFVLAHNALNLSLIASAIFALVVALLSSALNEVALHFPSRKLFATDDTLSPFILSSVALLFYQNVVLLLFGPTSFAIQLPIKTYSFGGIIISLYQLIPLVLITPALIAVVFLWNKTAVGKKLRAMRDLLLLSQAAGLNITMLFLVVTLISGSLGALAAVVIALNQDIRYTLGAVVILKGIAGAIIGGDRGPVGAAIGGLFVGVFEAATGWMLPTGLSDAFVGLLLISILVAAPKGLLTISGRPQ